MESRDPLASSSSVKMVPSPAGARRWMGRTLLSPWITEQTRALTAPFTKAPRSAWRAATIFCMRQIFIQGRSIRSMKILMTYAKQDHRRQDDVACAGCGFVNVFDTSGNFLRRLINNGELNAPWGLTLVEDGLWVGNFGDGKINVYDPDTGGFIETLMRADGTPLQLDGLWDLLPAQSGGGVFFTAGIADEEHGLFGIITEDP